jgi:hypothetical protein
MLKSKIQTLRGNSQGNNRAVMASMRELVCVSILRSTLQCLLKGGITLAHTYYHKVCSNAKYKKLIGGKFFFSITRTQVYLQVCLLPLKILFPLQRQKLVSNEYQQCLTLAPEAGLYLPTPKLEVLSRIFGELRGKQGYQVCGLL